MDGKAQTVAKAAWLFTPRLCASPPLSDFFEENRQANVVRE
jgi:hypothetical protein